MANREGRQTKLQSIAKYVEGDISQGILFEDGENSIDGMFTT